ncbi:UPF0061 protein C20G4.05c [Golovinomyces cichoracearum]|uniref:Selenoprotein O n=1 Tax=Golovinomyces cichoracearum TaxID=62708 RepID=A0A420ILC4_9PEZI|nr:UPF0061 protein C20G4.05c [Golovinomyces cichoracearum]
MFRTPLFRPLVHFKRSAYSRMSRLDDNCKYAGFSLVDLPKSWTFTSSLPPDPKFATPATSHKTPRDSIEPRQVKGALFTWIRPEETEKPELLAVSPRALRDLGIREDDVESDEFKQTVAGNRILGWDEEKEIGGYPWAQCYGGWQFGVWAGQLGDGRVISLFEITNPNTNLRYELQLKGAGITPYSRFADGKAVLRSSIREFICSEALHALGIPSTRALSLTKLPRVKVVRERIEPGAIVARFAQSWLRIGTFDILRARGERDLIRKLSTYIAENVFGGWESLPARNPSEKGNYGGSIETGIYKDKIEGPHNLEENRFTRLYREIVRRNAKTVAAWQAYAFTNGVLNTDNTSIYGLSMDFGPFAFLDNFDPQYTPNHDDHLSRYSYSNQPSVIWWNLVRLGESLGELIGIGSAIDDADFIVKGIDPAATDDLIARAQALITRAGEEYRAVFLAEYKRLMTLRLGLRTQSESDFSELFSELLDTLKDLELDFNHFFRKLSNLNVKELQSEKQRELVASIFFHSEGITGLSVTEHDARKRIAVWLEKWCSRISADWGLVEDESPRQAAMQLVNPKFIPRSWVLDEVITRVTEGDKKILDQIITMACSPFNESWGFDRSEEERWCGDVPRNMRAMHCSCSS